MAGSVGSIGVRSASASCTAAKRSAAAWCTSASGSPPKLLHARRVERPALEVDVDLGPDAQVGGEGGAGVDLRAEAGYRVALRFACGDVLVVRLDRLPVGDDAAEERDEDDEDGDDALVRGRVLVDGLDVGCFEVDVGHYAPPPNANDGRHDPHDGGDAGEDEARRGAAADLRQRQQEHREHQRDEPAVEVLALVAEAVGLAHGLAGVDLALRVAQGAEVRAEPGLVEGEAAGVLVGDDVRRQRQVRRAPLQVALGDGALLDGLLDGVGGVLGVGERRRLRLRAARRSRWRRRGLRPGLGASCTVTSLLAASCSWRTVSAMAWRSLSVANSPCCAARHATTAPVTDTRPMSTAMTSLKSIVRRWVAGGSAAGGSGGGAAGCAPGHAGCG